MVARVIPSSYHLLVVVDPMPWVNAVRGELWRSAVVRASVGRLAIRPTSDRDLAHPRQPGCRVPAGRAAPGRGETANSALPEIRSSEFSPATMLRGYFFFDIRCEILDTGSTHHPNISPDDADYADKDSGVL